MKNFIILLIVLTFAVSCGEDSGVSPESPISVTDGGDGQGGSLATFTLKGDYLYVVDESDLNVFNIEVPDNPVLVNNVRVGFNIETLFGFKEYLYIGSRNGMFIYSLDNPEFPVELSNVSHFTACDPVIANDSNAFVTLHSNTNCGNNINVLEIYDIRNITQPVLISSRNLFYPKGLGLFENFLIVSDDEIKIFDITNPQNSQFETSINQEVFDVIVRDNLLIAIGVNGLYQYQLENNSGQLKITPLSTIEI